MTEQPRDPDNVPTAPTSRPTPPAAPKPGEVATANADEPASPQGLSPEEQMALFEQDLKEKDWGHQPC